MESCQSPRKVLIAAHRLGVDLFRDYSCKFSRHDFTLAQLFACLVLREFYGLSYRRTEQLLRDSPQWLTDIGLSSVPDHNTLWRSFDAILKAGRFKQILDHQGTQCRKANLLRLSAKPLSIDSTCFEQRHRSVHYDRRCRQLSDKDKSNQPNRPGSWGKSVNLSRRRQVRAMPKLALAVAAGSHLILAAKSGLGAGSDAPDFDQLLFHAWRRAPVKTVVADAGYDSETNHCIARMDMGVRSIIPAGIGRPTSKLPNGRWRRQMAQRFARKADQPTYAQRTQSETVNSMIKRNQGSALRSRTPERRKKEMLLRAITHNIMLMCNEIDD